MSVLVFCGEDGDRADLSGGSHLSSAVGNAADSRKREDVEGSIGGEAGLKVDGLSLQLLIGGEAACKGEVLCYQQIGLFFQLLAEFSIDYAFVGDNRLFTVIAFDGEERSWREAEEIEGEVDDVTARVEAHMEVSPLPV